MSTADRHFIVARKQATVYIRELDPAQHPRHIAGGTTLDRTAAWEVAQRLARPAKLARSRAAQQPAQIVFIGTDGMSTVVQTAQRTQDLFEGKAR